jgi:hypothetical protein
MRKIERIIEENDDYSDFVRNCLSGSSPDLLIEMAQPLIKKLEEAKLSGKISEVDDVALSFLYKIKFFNFDISMVKKYDLRCRDMKIEMEEFLMEENSEKPG